MLTCPSLVSRPKACNTARIKVGRETHISAIVIHVLEGINPEAFEASMSSPMPGFCTGHVNPLSVHFIVTDLAAIQYAELNNTTFGLDYFKNPTWPGLPALFPLNDINAPFVHIAVKSECQNLIPLIKTICCIIKDVGYDLPVVAASDLQSDRPVYEIDPTLIAQVVTCLDGSVETPPTWIDIGNEVKDLKTCCATHTGQIYLLQHKIRKLEQCVQEHTCKIQELNELTLFLQGAVGQIPGLVTAIQILQGQVANILENCCPTMPESSCFHYQLLNGQEQLITPNQPVHLNPPTRITDMTPPIVTTGPLWRANLSEACTWSLNGIVRFKLNEWCAGTDVRILAVVCGVRTTIGTPYLIPTTGMQQVTLSFNNYLIPGGCDNVYFEISMDDQTAQIVTFADIQGCCI